MKIIPVIHHLARDLSIGQAVLAKSLGADGVFLISHFGADDGLAEIAAAAKEATGLFVGINLLSKSPLHAISEAVRFGLDAVWADDMGVDSSGLRGVGAECSAIAKGPGAPLLFSSVAFKYRPFEPNPERAAANAVDAGFIPTTSGAATGSPPSVDKIASMSKASGGLIAVASGMDPYNIADFAPHLSHVLVATGISLDGNLIDPKLLSLFIKNALRAKNPG